MDRLVLRDRLVSGEFVWPVGPPSGGTTPVTGCHSVIDRPEW